MGNYDRSEKEEHDFPRGDRTKWYAFATVALGVVVAGLAGIFAGWFSAPMDTTGWVAFLIWLLPVWMLWEPGRHDSGGLAAGAVCMVAGLLFQYEGLLYPGLAATITALLPFSPARVAWLVSAIGWMPAFGGLTSQGEPAGLT